MDFSFDINQVFSERVSILDQTLAAGRKSAGTPHLQAHIATVIDELGRASAKAQQLPASITSASKLQSQRHQLYLLKDGESNGGRGVVVGFLKVGYKKLFLLDRQGVHIEAEPLCVLDFYIAENLQRHGYGLELFDFMLQQKNLEPVLMAYDRPSPKFLSFLAKHFFLTQSVPQANNFVVFEGFFLNRSVVLQEQRARPWPFAPPHSPQQSVSSQCSHSLSVGSSPSRAPPRASPSSFPGGNRDQSPQSPFIERCRARRSSHHLFGSRLGLVARSSLYSRHMDSRAAGLLDRPLPGMRPVGDQSHALEYIDTHRLASIPTARSRFQPLSLPLLCASNKDGIHRQTSLDCTEEHLDSHAEARGAVEDVRALDSPQRSAPGMPVGKRHALEKEDDGGRLGWSWTVEENCYTAQWVKQKHEHKSTQPW
ncbi:alpha-tubulin N-acetyltransferase 1 isoform X2 [Cyclopterus lumpus]|uniref:alpha-tubulin N-acetyltransferase 1 isoform X2 n=1 Tax=Cyclopterus lumpus TaxID=8103 RepID=UPI001486D6F7|nr:alpha-tubulin N-acetyltransferase 1 isoform X2 [Cyclopterus lumpus]